MKKGSEEMKEFVSKLSEKEKQELLKLLEEALTPKVEEKKREIGKYEGKIFISEDFNEPNF
ncbi:hypothetical protein MMU07_00155 [Aquiflexum sp. LQ15W]|uniref:hypothetical protein n=1 Tax=Cognataquiflexum nitidum TaxID=2922272 RepID=UPI001F142209|nr:hypothetical protein [Cognataquiflexum nitidum]MCH6197971.1 hypothetical protein [Cognataquiflexum nitidum]